MKPKKLIGRLSEFNHFGEESREDNAFEGDEFAPKSQIEEFVEAKRNKGLPNNYSCIADEGIRMLCTYECRSCSYGVKR